jgi:hypothetical protein
MKIYTTAHVFHYSTERKKFEAELEDLEKKFEEDKRQRQLSGTPQA